MFCPHCGTARPDAALFCPMCGKSLDGLPTLPAGLLLQEPSAVIAAPQVAFFNVGTTKLVMMTIATFGLYPVYWLYKNWTVEAELSGALLNPVLRALFAPLFIYSLVQRLQDRSVSMNLPSKLRPGLLTVAFILPAGAGRLPDPFWVISVLVGVVLVPIQNQLARINTARSISVGKEARFSGVNISWLVVSAIVWFLVILGMFLPEVE